MITASVKVTCANCKLSMKKELFTMKDGASLEAERGEARKRAVVVQTADPWALPCKGCGAALSFNLWKIWEKQKFTISQYIRCHCNGCGGNVVERRVRLFDDQKAA